MFILHWSFNPMSISRKPSKPNHCWCWQLLDLVTKITMLLIFFCHTGLLSFSVHKMVNTYIMLYFVCICMLPCLTYWRLFNPCSEHFISECAFAIVLTAVVSEYLRNIHNTLWDGEMLFLLYGSTQKGLGQNYILILGSIVRCCGRGGNVPSYGSRVVNLSPAPDVCQIFPLRNADTNQLELFVVLCRGSY